MRLLDRLLRAVLYVVSPLALYWFLVGLAMMTRCASAESAVRPGDVKGCYVTYLATSGKFLFEPFLKVGDKGSPSQDGEPEIWGFRPWNLEPPDEKGNTPPVNILADRFVPMGANAEVAAGSARRRIRCPEGMW